MPAPFRIFKETNTSPNARFLRTSYGEKIIDAFFAFAGSINLFTFFIHPPEKQTDPNTRTQTLGILDLPIFFIPTVLDILTFNAWKSDNFFVKIVLGFILAVITIPLNLIRIVIAGVLAFNPLSLFIIFAVHIISQYASGGAKLNENVAKIENNVVFWDKKTNREQPGNNGQKFMVDYVNTQVHNQHGSYVTALCPKFIITSCEQRHLLGLALNPTVGISPSKDNGFFYLPLFTDNSNATLTTGAHSVLKLNTWRVTEQMEEYVEMNRSKADLQVKKDVEYCEQVLRLIK